jgi:hypothetical protein
MLHRRVEIEKKHFRKLASIETIATVPFWGAEFKAKTPMDMAPRG